MTNDSAIATQTETAGLTAEELAGVSAGVNLGLFEIAVGKGGVYLRFIGEELGRVFLWDGDVIY